MKFEVEMISKDKHTYILKVESKNEEDVNKIALDHIIEIGYDIYEYKIKEIKRINA